MADSDDNRAEAGRWTKGRSGNPGGRPKLPEEVKAQIRGLAPLAIAALAKALESEDERVVMRGGGIAISGVDEAKIFASERGRYGATGEWGIWELRIMMGAR